MSEPATAVIAVRVEGTLLAPVALPRIGFIVGDALLHAAQVRLAHPTDWVLRPPAVWEPVPLPVLQQAGVAWTSCVQLPEAVWDTASLAKQPDAQALQAHPDAHGRMALDPGRQYMYRPAVERFPTVWAPRFVVDYAVPADQLEAFLALVGAFPLLSLGRYRHHGYGRIGTVSATQLPHDAAAVVWASDGAPRRPVPAAWCPDPPPRSILRAARLRPPYWFGPEDAAYCPLVHDLYGGPSCRT